MPASRPNRPNTKNQSTSEWSPAQQIDLYEQLSDLNQHCLAAANLIAEFSRKRLVPKNECAYYLSMTEEVRASISQSLSEYLSGYEITAAASSERKRLKLERKLFESIKVS